MAQKTKSNNGNLKEDEMEVGVSEVKVKGMHEAGLGRGRERIMHHQLSHNTHTHTVTHGQ